MTIFCFYMAMIASAHHWVHRMVRACTRCLFFSIFLETLLQDKLPFRNAKTECFLLTFQNWIWRQVLNGYHNECLLQNNFKRQQNLKKKSATNASAHHWVHQIVRTYTRCLFFSKFLDILLQEKNTFQAPNGSGNEWCSVCFCLIFSSTFYFKKISKDPNFVIS